MAIFGAIISPPTWAESTIQKHDYNYKILIGISSYNSGSGEREYERSTRSYILLPSLRAIKITKHTHSIRDNDSNLQEQSELESKVTTEESTLLSYYFLLSYLGFLFGTWWYWIRPSSKQTEN